MGKTKAERWVEKFNWKKVKGIKVNLAELRDNTEEYWDYLYLHKDDLSDYVEECYFWENDEVDDKCFEDIDGVIEFIEENTEEKYNEY